jgi:peptidoglycan-associated lipoprotein
MNRMTLRLCAALLLLAGCSTPDEEPQGLAAGEGGAAGAGGAGAGVASSELAGQPSPGTQEDLAVSVGDRVFFDYDSVVLNTEATSVLDGQAAWLKQYPNVIVTIEGHADERGTTEYNLALGDRRATAVKNYLVRAWSQNRRAVTTIATTG